MKKWLWSASVIVLILAIIFIVLNSTSSVPHTVEEPGNGILIGYSLATLQEERWQRDRDDFVQTATDLGAIVDAESANNNTQTQISQIKSMIIKGVNVLVIAPNDAGSLTDVIDQAHKAGIKVIAYDRMITNADTDLYVSFDNEKVGEYEAQSVIDALKGKLGAGKKLKVAYIGGATTDNNALLVKQGSFKVLQPFIDNGEIQIVVNTFTDNWDPANAYKELKTYLDSSNGALDAVVVANDGMAFGCIQALHEHNLDGKVPVSGQDAELSAVQRIIAGTQTATVYKPIILEASTAANFAVQLANNQFVTTSSAINNGKINVPSILLQAEIVTKNNIDSTIIKDGFYTSKEVYGK